MDPGDPLAHTQTDGAIARPDAAALIPGSTLGRYRLERVLGQGGMGVVWAAHDPDLDRRVAVKLLRSEGGADARARLLREARAMARLSHRNVITVHEVGSQGSRDFVAMELIDGESLEVWLRKPRPADEVLHVFREAGLGLACAHAAGMVHRDFKPHNVLLGRDGRVVVTDFGLARSTTDVARDAGPPRATAVSGLEDTIGPAITQGDGSWSSTLTATGALIGTPAYMAPEQFAGGPPDPRTDQFAFCVSLWEGLAGERPYKGDSLAALAKSTAAGPPTGHPRVPAWLIPVLRRGLAPVATARWPSMPALLAAMRSPHPRRRWPWVAAAGAVIAGGAWFALHGGAAATSAPSMIADEAVCADLDTMVASIGEPAAMDRLREHFGADAKVLASLTPAVEHFRGAWRGAYAKVCADRADGQRRARVTCLETQRDQASDQLAALALVPPAAITRVAEADLLPHVAACLAAAPAPPPTTPADPQLATKVRDLRVRMSAALMQAFRGVEPDWAGLTAEAEASGYAPVLVEVLLRHAMAVQVVQDLDGAAALYERAELVADGAQLAALRADALIGLAELVQQRAFDPERARAAIDRARAAVRGAGDLVGHRLRIDSLDGGLAFRESRWDDAIKAFSRAKDAAQAIGDRRGYLRNTALLAEVTASRARNGDLEAAIELIRAAAADVGVGDRGYAYVHSTHAHLATALGLWDEARAADQRASFPPPPPASLPTIHGTVVDAAGKPVAHADVWSSDQPHMGNPRFLVSAPNEAVALGYATHAETDANGRFALVATPGAATAAELGAQRSSPAAAADGVTLRLGPTYTLRGTVADVNIPRALIRAVLASPAGQRWIIMAPVAADGTFELGGLVPGVTAVELMENGDAGVSNMTGAIVDMVGDRSGVELRGLRGAANLDVIVRSDRASPIPVAQVFAIVGRASIKRLSDLRRAIDSAMPAVTGFSVLPSAAERAVPQRFSEGDTHVVLRGVPVGPATVCAVPFPVDLFEPQLALLSFNDQSLDVFCVPTTLEAGAQTIVIVAAPAPRIK